jgi:hypothetical protein
MVGERGTNGGEERGIQGLVENTPFGRTTGTWKVDTKPILKKQDERT